MKIINANGAMPGIEDSLIIYSGQTGTVYSLTPPSTCKQFKVHTEIRSSLFINIIGIHVDGYHEFLGYTYSKNSNGTYDVVFQVPAYWNGTYLISGSTLVSDATNPELIDMGETLYTYWSYEHRHSNPTILVSQLLPDPGQASMGIGVSADGASVTYYPFVVITDVPVFTLPALNTPTDGATIDVVSGTSTTYSWDAATNMLITDAYKLVISDETAGTSFEYDVDGTTTTKDVPDGNLADFVGHGVSWYVVATNSNGSAVTEKRILNIIES